MKKYWVRRVLGRLLSFHFPLKSSLKVKVSKRDNFLYKERGDVKFCKKKVLEM